jgi:hypothetical protein
MEMYIFLTKKYEENETTYLAIDPAKIESLNVCDTYDSNGQTVDHETAGDYHIDNQYSDAKHDCEKAILEKFGKTVSIDAHNACVEVIENTEVEEWITENEETAGDFINEINTFIKSWCEENHTLETCEGFNYWDGSNYRSVITNYHVEGYESHSIVEDEEIIEKLNTAIENKEWVSDSFGLKKYEFEDVKIVVSQFSGAWEAYSLTID